MVPNLIISALISLFIVTMFALKSTVLDTDSLIYMGKMFGYLRSETTGDTHVINYSEIEIKDESRFVKPKDAIALIEKYKADNSIDANMGIDHTEAFLSTAIVHRRLDEDDLARLKKHPKTCVLVESTSGFEIVQITSGYTIVSVNIAKAASDIFNIEFMSILDTNSKCLFSSSGCSMLPINKFVCGDFNNEFWNIYMQIAGLAVENNKECYVFNDNLVVARTFVDCHAHWSGIFDTLPSGNDGMNTSVIVKFNSEENTFVFTYVPKKIDFAWIRVDDEKNISVSFLYLDPTKCDFPNSDKLRCTLFNVSEYLKKKANEHYNCAINGKKCDHKDNIYYNVTTRLEFKFHGETTDVYCVPLKEKELEYHRRALEGDENATKILDDNKHTVCIMPADSEGRGVFPDLP